MAEAQVSQAEAALALLRVQQEKLALRDTLLRVACTERIEFHRIDGLRGWLDLDGGG